MLLVVYGFLHSIRKQSPTLKSLSMGKLNVPSPRLKKTVSDYFELIFKAYHDENNSFSKDKFVIAEL